MAFNITEVFHKTKENIYLKEQEFSSFKANKPWLFSPKFFSKVPINSENYLDFIILETNQ